jgi:deoxyribonuclease-4
MIGFHVSIAKSLDLVFERAADLGCNTLQMFTRNPRGWSFKPLTDDQIESFREKRRKSGFRYVADHMPYLPNLASPDRAVMKRSRQALDEEVRRCDALGIDYLVVHLGSHMGKGTMVGVRNVADACGGALSRSSGGVTVLLENMAGQKNSVGSRFEELRMIMDLAKSDRIGVCLDTCHLLAAGFDIRTQEAVRDTVSLFDSTVGMKALRLVHLNDSKGELGSGLDRHENLGKGKIGRRGMKAFLSAPGILERPIILETPYRDDRTLREDLKTARGLISA